MRDIRPSYTAWSGRASGALFPCQSIDETNPHKMKPFFGFREGFSKPALVIKSPNKTGRTKTGRTKTGRNKTDRNKTDRKGLSTGDSHDQGVFSHCRGHV